MDDDDDDPTVFFVDQIIDKRCNQSSTEYLVKWTGWPSEHNTWEPDVNIIDTNLITAYEERQTRKMLVANSERERRLAMQNAILVDDWMLPDFFRRRSEYEVWKNKPATEVDGEEAIDVEEVVEMDVGTKTCQSKPCAAKSAQKVKQVELDKESMN